MLALNRIHHVSIICSDYEKSKAFYTKVLGLTILTETYREERMSYKLDLTLHGQYIIELFSFPSPPARVSQPEAAGLRHLAFEVDHLIFAVEALKKMNIISEPIRFDEITGKYFTFITDPDHLPIELYEK
jgi:glyoxylase I family protein